MRTIGKVVSKQAAPQQADEVLYLEYERSPDGRISKGVVCLIIDKALFDKPKVGGVITLQGVL